MNYKYIKITKASITHYYSRNHIDIPYDVHRFKEDSIYYARITEERYNKWKSHIDKYWENYFHTQRSEDVVCAFIRPNSCQCGVVESNTEFCVKEFRDATYEEIVMFNGVLNYNQA